MNSFITLFLALLVMHVFIDFYCQPNAWVADKEQKKHASPKLAIHSFLHAIGASIPVIFVTQHLGSLVLVVLTVGVTHWLIDLAKIHQGKRLRFFLVDQTLHITVLALIAVHASGLEISFQENILPLLSVKNIAIVLGYLAIFKPASVLISLVLQKYLPNNTGNDHGADLKGLIAGGEMIGYLERLLILTFVINGQYAVIGFVLAAKSIFRFGELNNTKSHNLAEYVLLGSLLSVTITSMVGIFIKLFM